LSRRNVQNAVHPMPEVDFYIVVARVGQVNEEEDIDACVR
jgi:hypothetical protein